VPDELHKEATPATEINHGQPRCSFELPKMSRTAPVAIRLPCSVTTATLIWIKGSVGD
jgi:hypothetical protein